MVGTEVSSTGAGVVGAVTHGHVKVDDGDAGMNVGMHE